MATISEKVERQVVLLDENKTAYEAAVLMCDKHIGSVVVTRASKVIGLFTERDLMHQVIQERRNPDTVTIKEVMRADVPRVVPDETGENCIELMKQHKCRHLLVYDGEAFVGIISLRHLLVLLLGEKEELIRQLTKYVTN
ncbi:MAG: CBS domain-containing protein [Candidatus Muproteobacteria bacterium RIFCSPHIGHO2_12_FULL_60_33]|uniref:CBS domain-containing protein n=1 Tax=Candidatus Muproteobacteria bacterium RIFCSPLOWO2_01_FULL_60_18 TaxID=1817768 RepID=A0A1F6U402_9PROT|nr:MAG: CBS domain-containing protein [Candidatus Muproteobacteria bacterium RIFCSPLOWO2_01_FULL_60_18]OGI52223.1 MAG: CBS domain-containing protein [Candidatus Muproteobacteria bacterium RIFCSPHIGHO2_01_60_12]OGI54867.1 MAG: CBS domain-containing protein [Candidatus Muproteobacteria bacterium RIFCSPHIGHO2_12_FULL_60_33]